MSTVTSREKTMLLVAVVAVLYAAAALSYKKQAANWKSSERLYRSAQKKVQEERALIAARDEWLARYEQMRGLMPVFPYDQDVDTHWLNIMDAAATRNGLTIARRQTGKEVEVGDVFELPIECKGWEGTLEALVKFLYDLQGEGAMLDVRQLFIQPVSGRPGYLRGTFTLTCAYMRGEESSKVQKVESPKVEDVPATNAPPDAAEAEPSSESTESGESMESNL
jgi:Tfp pilus assembly protein PilO